MFLQDKKKKSKINVSEKAGMPKSMDSSYVRWSKWNTDALYMDSKVNHHQLHMQTQ